jgi:hypothetical protein
VMPQLDLAPPPPAVPPPRTDDATGAAMSDAAPASLSSAGDE